MMVALIIALFSSLGFAQTVASPSAAELLRHVDNNEIYKTIEYDGEIIIEYQNRRYVKTLKAWARENSDFFMEFFNPEDKGTKYLKKGGRLYVYSPDNEGIMLISGHMLKESMMGSDMSYEDAANNETLSSRYEPTIIGTETWKGRTTWLLELNSKKKAESYPKRKIWIDKETRDVLHYELYALSGVKLKEYNLIKIGTFENRRFPIEIELCDLLRKNSKTTFIMKNVVLDKPIADKIFNQRNLER
ncbi:MAG: outer membrane lipoprotein-sorting protein [Fibromonadaceae bacterium]|jgi:outer membrane lipoprotein-sorting protein|nr:outer membrane lipoprotein-sorting protein [Fibromonadaceae bacterium]